MFVHLKDKAKIRHKKRWSQCMYMYYLLGHRLMELPISVDRKEVLAENTYILTLDGDIDFQPPAVSLLVDLMKKNRCANKLVAVAVVAKLRLRVRVILYFLFTIAS
jgi:chitin synthase